MKKGVERVSQCLEEVKSLYKEVKRHKLEVPVDAYHTTIDESLPLFIKKYNIIFEAHNTMASIDYPLGMDNMRLQGIVYIQHYLERLQLENEFCLRFNPDALIHMMESFGRLHRFDYRIELFNIFELSLHNSLFSILSGGDADQVQISTHQFERLERMPNRMRAGSKK
nr:DUF6179 domain-containing protein [Alicyclobacillus kakegawensis]